MDDKKNIHYIIKERDKLPENMRKKFSNLAINTYYKLYNIIKIYNYYIDIFHTEEEINKAKEKGYKILLWYRSLPACEKHKIDLKIRRYINNKYYSTDWEKLALVLMKKNGVMITYQDFKNINYSNNKGKTITKKDLLKKAEKDINDDGIYYL